MVVVETVLIQVETYEHVAWDEQRSSTRIILFHGARWMQRLTERLGTFRNPP